MKHAHVSAQRVLCLQSCMDKAPSCAGRRMMEEDQGTAVGLVNAAGVDRRPQVSVVAGGLDLHPKYCRFTLDYDSQGLIVD